MREKEEGGAGGEEHQALQGVPDQITPVNKDQHRKRSRNRDGSQPQSTRKNSPERGRSSQADMIVWEQQYAAQQSNLKQPANSNQPTQGDPFRQGGHQSRFEDQSHLFVGSQAHRSTSSKAGHVSTGGQPSANKQPMYSTLNRQSGQQAVSQVSTAPKTVNFGDAGSKARSGNQNGQYYPPDSQNLQQDGHNYQQPTHSGQQQVQQQAFQQNGYQQPTHNSQQQGQQQNCQLNGQNYQQSGQNYYQNGQQYQQQAYSGQQQAQLQPQVFQQGGYQQQAPSGQQQGHQQNYHQSGQNYQQNGQNYQQNGHHQSMPNQNPPYPMGYEEEGFDGNGMFDYEEGDWYTMEPTGGQWQNNHGNQQPYDDGGQNGGNDGQNHDRNNPAPYRPPSQLCRRFGLRNDCSFDTFEFDFQLACKMHQIPERDKVNWLLMHMEGMIKEHARSWL
ncbi:MAG: hypothetical protein GY821_06900, partial [Gammaproteobacteria bacterium]|nr:hypothetical protein [Gammaproteobacteria bacterium]